jgi:hypothetical protein
MSVAGHTCRSPNDGSAEYGQHFPHHQCRALRSDNGEFATLKEVAFQRLARHPQHSEIWISPLVDQVELALAAAFAGWPIVMG